jgi:hypothetical protein
VIVKNGREIKTVAEWFELAPPMGGLAHWVEGRSALELAKAWCLPEPHVPEEIRTLLETHHEASPPVILYVTPEQRAPFDNFPGQPCNMDLSGLAVHPDGPLAISFEAKSDEPFGSRVREKLSVALDQIANDEGTNLVTRIQNLV